MDGPGTAGGPRTLARLWEGSLERLGDRPALWFEGVSHRSGDLVDRATRVATGLAELGVRPGDRVLVLMANCAEVSITYHAVWRAGAAVTPVIFLVTAPELRHILAAAEPAALVTTADLMPTVLAATAGLRLPLVVLGSAGPDDPRVIDYRDLEAAAPGRIVDRAEDDLAALLFTGGTTGASKGVPLTQLNLWSAGWSSRQVSELPGITRTITALPLSHSYGVLVTVGGQHAAEAVFAVLLRWFDPARWLALAAEHRIQVAAVVPSMVAALLAQPVEEYDLAELRHVFCGAAPLAPALVGEFERRVPSAQLLEGYGLTESSGIATGTPPGQRRLGTVGRPVPGVGIRIVDDLGADLPTGHDGEILLRGDNVTAGYWRNAESDAAAGAVHDGWLRTGDIGHLDADGYLSVVDRKKDLILRGGYNVFPRDIEDALLAHPVVSAAAVVGRPDPRLGEEVVAYVAVRPGATVTAAELVEFSRGRLAKHKYPREIRIVPQIPLTPVGKVDRKRLRRQVAEEAAGRP